MQPQGSTLRYVKLIVLQMTEQARSLHIKTNAVKRTTKEYLYYFKEKKREQEKLDKMESDGADSYDIKQQLNVVQESDMMIPETKKSLEALLVDLKSFLNDMGSDLDPASEQGAQAHEVVSAAEDALK